MDIGDVEYDENTSVGDALAQYLRQSGLDDGRYQASFHIIKFLGFIPLLVPNPKGRRLALPRHDLNHVLSGCNAIGTRGELDIVGFELGARGGCGRYWVAWLINIGLLPFALMLRPRRLFRAFRQARSVQNAYTLEEIGESFLSRPLGEVRRELGILK